MGALNTERLNLMLLNRLDIVDAVLVLTDGISSTLSQGSGAINGVISLTGISRTDTAGEAKLTAVIFLTGESETETLDGATFADITFLVDGVSETLSEFEGRIGVYQDISIEYTGDLAPGDVLVIDSNKFTAALNGANVIDKINGDWPIIAPGSTLVAYSDTESDRLVKITVKHRDKQI